MERAANRVFDFREHEPDSKYPEWFVQKHTDTAFVESGGHADLVARGMEKSVERLILYQSVRFSLA